MEQQFDEASGHSSTNNNIGNERKIADAHALSSVFFETHVKDKESRGGFIRTITLACKPDSEKVELTLEEFHKMMKFLSGGRH
ncbi:MAG: hypothetical protein WB779_04280 [Ignavibacteriaceae bacterium]|jgi:hypothetical protein